MLAISTKYIYTLLFAVTIIFYGRADYFFYLSWISSVLIILLYFFEILKFRKLDYTLTVAILAMSIWCIYSLFLTPYAFHSPTHLKYISITLLYIVTAAIFLRWVTTSFKRFNHFFFLLTNLWIAINVFILFLYLFNLVEFETGSFSGFFQNRNIFSVITTFIFGVNLILLVPFQSGKFKYIPIYLLFGLILVSLSIKGLVGAFIFIFIHVFFVQKNKHRFIVIPFLIFLLIPIFVIENPIKVRIERFTNETSELKISESSYERKWLRNQGFELILKNPLTGIGVNNSVFQLITPYQQYLIEIGKEEPNSDKPGSYSHNNYIEMGLNAGIPAIILYYIILLYIFLVMLNKKYHGLYEKKIKLLIVSLIIYKLIIDYAMVSYYDLANIIIYSLILTFYIKLKRKSLIWKK